MILKCQPIWDRSNRLKISSAPVSGRPATSCWPQRPTWRCRPTVADRVATRRERTRKKDGKVPAGSTARRMRTTSGKTETVRHRRPATRRERLALLVANHRVGSSRRITRIRPAITAVTEGIITTTETANVKKVITQSSNQLVDTWFIHFLNDYR